jgi:hypothetical protein
VDERVLATVTGRAKTGRANTHANADASAHGTANLNGRVNVHGRGPATVGASGARRGTARRALALPVLGALLAVGASACSSDNSAALDSWSKQVCDNLRDPVTQSRAAQTDVAQVKTGEAPGDLQKRLAGDLGTLGATNNQIADAIDKAGAPKIDNGAGVQKDAVSELRQAAQGYLDVQKTLAGLPTDDQAKFADGLKSVGDQIQQLAKLSTGALNTLQTGDLGKAIAKQPGCKSQPVAGGSASPASGASGAAASPGAPSGSAAPSAGGSPAAGASPSGSASAGGSASSAPPGSPSGSPSTR